MKGDKIIIERTYLHDATLGDAYVLDADKSVIFRFKTLELPWKDNERGKSCIPEGTYKVQEMTPNPKRASL